jgi:hypothetical protein
VIKRATSEDESEGKKPDKVSRSPYRFSSSERKRDPYRFSSTQKRDPGNRYTASQREANRFSASQKKRDDDLCVECDIGDIIAIIALMLGDTGA